MSQKYSARDYYSLGRVYPRDALRAPFVRGRRGGWQPYMVPRGSVITFGERPCIAVSVLPKIGIEVAALPKIGIAVSKVGCDG